MICYHTHGNDQNTTTVVNYCSLQKRKLSSELKLTIVEGIECHFHVCDNKSFSLKSNFHNYVLLIDI